jgi:HD-like signal output (HDOD) protein
MRIETLDKLFETMQKSRGIPALEDSIMMILDSLNDDKKSIKEIVKPIVSDFTITQKVLKLANSAMYAPFSKSVSNISDALLVLGQDAISHIVLSVSVISSLDSDENNELSKTILASEIARTVCPENLMEEASVASLMGNLGRLLVDKYMPDELKAITEKINNGMSPENAEKAVLGMTILELGIGVAKRWKLPSPIIATLDGTGNKEIIEIARFSHKASVLIHEEKYEEAAALVDTITIPDTNKHRFSTLVRRKEEGITYNSEEAPVPTHRELSLRDYVMRLTEKPKLPINDLSSSVFGVLADLFEMSHCLLFVSNQIGYFHVLNGQGKNFEEIKSKFKVSVEFKPTAFHASIKNNVYIYIDDVKRLKDSSLPSGYRRYLAEAVKFIVLPISNIDGMVTAFLYFDWDTVIELSDGELNAIKEIRDLFLDFYSK